MRRFDNMKEYSDDELIVMVYLESEDWQRDAVKYAKTLLQTKGISDDVAKARLKQIIIENEAFWTQEFEDRQYEEYPKFELILIGLFWFKSILRDWNLGKDGYIKMRKQRLYSITGGIVFYLLIILSSATNNHQQEQLDFINQITETDSIAKSKVDWSGNYVFIDSNPYQNDKLVWTIMINKTQNKHEAILSIVNGSTNISINCIGLVKGQTLEFFPNSSSEIFNKQKVSYYDRLFIIRNDKNRIYTTWDKVSPLYHSKNSGYNIFKRQ